MKLPKNINGVEINIHNNNNFNISDIFNPTVDDSNEKSILTNINIINDIPGKKNDVIKVFLNQDFPLLFLYIVVLTNPPKKLIIQKQITIWFNKFPLFSGWMYPKKLYIKEVININNYWNPVPTKVENIIKFFGFLNTSFDTCFQP